MALSEKHRSSIYLTLAPMLGEEEAEALLSQFPARELDEPVTKEFVRAEISGLRAEMADMKAELRGEISGLRTEISGVRTELRADISELRAEFYDRLRQQTVWMAGALIAGMGVASGIASVVP